MQVDELLRLLAKSGIRLDEDGIRELKLEFSTLSLKKLCSINEQVGERQLQPQLQRSGAVEALKKAIRAKKGNMKDYLPYLGACIAEQLAVERLPTSAMKSLAALHEFALAKITESEFEQLGDIAFNQYRADYNATYQITTG